MCVRSLGGFCMCAAGVRPDFACVLQASGMILHVCYGAQEGPACALQLSKDILHVSYRYCGGIASVLQGSRRFCMYDTGVGGGQRMYVTGVSGGFYTGFT